LLRSDLAAYRTLETWGSSLFLGALGFAAKQFMEWERTPAETERISLDGGAFLLPAIMGLVAFVFLRTVNFRSHKTRLALLAMSDMRREGINTSFGIVGLILSSLPLAFGYATSWYFSAGNEIRAAQMSPLWSILFVTFATAVAVSLATRTKCYTVHAMAGFRDSA